MYTQISLYLTASVPVKGICVSGVYILPEFCVIQYGFVSYLWIIVIILGVSQLNAQAQSALEQALRYITCQVDNPYLPLWRQVNG